MPSADLDDPLRELLPRLRRFALWLTRDVHSADDLVQSTLERALSRWSTRRDASALRSWLFTILYRQFVDTTRRAKRYAWLLGRIKDDDEPQWPSAEDHALARSMLDAFGRLSTEQRSLLLLVAVEGFSYQEVAELLDIPIGTVMSRLSRARQALRALGDGEISAPSLRLMK
ncbi:RNA polymerase sigma factor [Burkholderia thailandensis]|uniref:RNA polymerase sigma factor, sigma-70 family protein n=2 Tax=Burkholderia thailandensis TaxID=57975 RepID=A0AAW9D4Z6_BURTH|nr:sigma-70 family RNA polymerase sigma factor [Burkholderia thailandensis]ABC36632.1 RNA polymerase sigma-70 factor, ECF subfamily [Burkholderia thailandensis E264]AHI72906.1 RNA polymerase sigma factor, sigma-70 family protein [Burkholderia thailandensis 2002721723]AHI80079.1 RNA polymerase sigma factor, sigma-70 family protein [Burkholderia thailandensis E444]AIC88692.1 RNA polymerase sigma factor, sigma-70 family protein [Burkholderia thailandensis USAMRU Malaysia \